MKEIVKAVSALFPKAKFYEANAPIQNGLYIVFEGIGFETHQINYEFKLLVVGNSLDKNSQSVLPQCDELLRVIEANRANCIEHYPSKLRPQSLTRNFVREGLFCYEIAFVLEIRVLKGV